VMRQAVGTTPFIIGTKLKSLYFRGERYLETTIDVNSNATAARITSYVAGALSSLSIWLGFVLEGKTTEQLPEQLLGVCLLTQTIATPGHSHPTESLYGARCMVVPMMLHWRSL
jgi:hypothetical protein